MKQKSRFNEEELYTLYCLYGGNCARVARYLGISRQAVSSRLKRANWPVARYPILKPLDMERVLFTYATTNSYRATGREFNVCHDTVKKKIDRYLKSMLKPQNE